MRNFYCLLLILLIFACSDDKSNNAQNQDSNDEPVAENVVVVWDDDSDLISTEDEISNGLYKIEFASEIPDVTINDIVIGDQGKGFLRKVVNVSTSENVLTLQTIQANLDDVFNDASIQFDSNISIDSRNDVLDGTNINVNYTAEGVQMNDDGLSYEFSDIILYQDGIATFSISEGLVTFNPNFSFKADYSFLGGLDYLEFKTNNAELSINCKLDYTIAQEFNLPTFEKTLIDFDKSILILVGGIPVIVVINTKLVASLDASVAASISTTFDWTETLGLTTGVEYENDEWSGIFDASSDFTINSMTFGGQVNLAQNLTITPRVSVEFYDVIGPYCEPKMTEDFQFNIASPSLDWDSNLKVGLDLKTGVDINVFGNSVLDFSVTNSVQEEIWNAPTNLTVQSGNNQSGIENQVLEEPLVVKVTDVLGNTLPFVPVYFTVLQGDGTVTNNVVLSDDNGLASEMWILGGASQIQQVEAKIKKADGSDIQNANVFFTATSNEPDETSITLSGDLNFGDVMVNEVSEPKTLIISNPNSVSITVSSLEFPVGFSSNSEWSSGVIQSGESESIEVVFSPEEAIEYQGFIVVENNTNSEENSIVTNGTGILPNNTISLSGDLNFGNVELNNTSTGVLNIDNQSNVPLLVSDIQLPSGFSSNWSNGTINPNSSFDVEISFTPTQAINYSGDIVVINNLDSDNNVISVIGNGFVAPNVLINVFNDIDFGEVLLFQSEMQSFTIENVGNAQVGVTMLQVPSGFDVDWNGGIIPVGQSQIVNVTFIPIDTVVYSGEIVVLSNATPINNSISVNGLGITDDTISIEGNLQFGDIEINTSDQRTFTITNNSINNVNVSSIDIPEGFTVNWSSGVIPGNSTQDVEVTFNPQEVQVYDGVITVNNDLDDENNTASITGEGVVLDFVYPSNGNYGVNILDVNNGGFGGATYSMRALIPKLSQLRVRVTGSFALISNNPNAGDWTWQVSGGGPNLVVEFDSAQDGVLDFALLINPAGVLIEVFEEGATEPTFTNN